MKILLDTCTFLWMAIDAPQLSRRAKDLFSDPANEVYLSAVSSWEIAVKHAAGKLPLPEPPSQFVPSRRGLYGIEELPLDEEAALHLARLPKCHRDPFDRMLICQSIVHGLAILSPDPLLSLYPARITW